ncbi:MAG: hypothetical protein JST82_13950 [Bacteroidetes bacterium]|nr:hypothetical protein [Bacteroidota bacterium]
MNEAELQSRIAEFTKKFLPTFAEATITQQHSFSLKLGHHNIIVDGAEPGKYAKRAIYDILIEVNGKPLILLELKRLGLPITTEDRKQGLSYARLTHEITPITVLTNGNETIVLNTFTNEEITGSAITEDIVQNVLSKGINLAANDYKNAIELLFEKDRNIVFSVINNITAQTFGRMTGELNEYNKPICRDFIVKRDVHDKFIEELDTSKFCSLVGDPLAGKTNFLFQLFEDMRVQHHGVLYIDCQDTQYSIFQMIANSLTRELRYLVTPDKVREWLLLSFDDATDKKFIVICDHLRYNSNVKLFEEITELTHLLLNTNNCIVVSTDTANYALIAKNPDRHVETVIGKLFKKMVLKTFSIDEYKNAHQTLIEKFKILIVHGGQYAKEYRNPRIWRLLIEAYGDEEKEGALRAIDSVPSFDMLEVLAGSIQIHENVIADFKALAKAYIENIQSIRKKPELSLMSLNMAVVQEAYLKKYINTDAENRLLNSGFLERRVTEHYDIIYLPKLPEILSVFAIEYLKDKYAPLFASKFDITYHEFMQTCEYLPYGEIIAGIVILRLGKQPKIFSDIMNKLMQDKPVLEVSSGERLLQLYMPDYGNIRLKIKSDEESRFLGNSFPFLVLSHIVRERIGDDSENPDLIRFKIMVEIANTDFIMRRADEILMTEGLPQYDFEGVGSFTSSEVGIIEPIVQSLKYNMLTTPKYFGELFEFAKANKLYHLLHRLYLAGRGAAEIGNTETIQLADEAENAFTEMLPVMFATAMADDKNDIVAIEEIANGLRH